MLLQFCDKCGKPLSEGCLARGEAVARNGETICAHCLQAERAAQPAPAPTPAVTGALSHYEQQVWHCGSCGIPVTALDLIEGRASRHDGRLLCIRCSGARRSANLPAAPAAVPAALPAIAAPSARASALPARPAAVSRPATRAQEYADTAKREERRPVLPIILFAIVLPMFAVSVFFAISSQQKLSEAMALRDNTPGSGPRAERPREDLEPPTRPQPPTLPANDTAPAANTPRGTPQPVAALPGDVAAELAEVELALATPVNRQLQSKELAEVWEGLIAAGSRRLVGCRPFVRALLHEPDDSTRAMACHVAALLQDAGALPDLARMAESDPAEFVRHEARKARGRLTGEATRELQDMTTDELEAHLRALQRELERRRK